MEQPEVDFLRLKLHFDRVEVVNPQMMIHEDLVKDIFVELVDASATFGLLSAIASFPNVKQLVSKCETISGQFPR